MECVGEMMGCGGGAMSLHIQLEEGEGVWSSTEIWGNRFGLAGWWGEGREWQMLFMALRTCRSCRKQSVPKPWGGEGDKRGIKSKPKSAWG